MFNLDYASELRIVHVDKSEVVVGSFLADTKANAFNKASEHWSKNYFVKKRIKINIMKDSEKGLMLVDSYSLKLD